MRSREAGSNMEKIEQQRELKEDDKNKRKRGIEQSRQKKEKYGEGRADLSQTNAVHEKELKKSFPRTEMAKLQR